MIKLATGDGKTYVSLTKNEFILLAKALPKDVADGTDISLAALDAMLKAAATPTQLLQNTKLQLENTVNALGALLTSMPST
jgi:hypothetical protein